MKSDCIKPPSLMKGSRIDDFLKSKLINSGSKNPLIIDFLKMLFA